MYASAYVWAKIINYLEERLSAVTVSAWFDDAEVVELNEEHLILYSASDFRREIIRRRCTQYIQDALKEIFNSDAKLIVFGDEELNSFLFTLGCYVGEPITVISRRRSGCTVSIKDGRYNIDKDLASAILV